MPTHRLRTAYHLLLLPVLLIGCRSEQVAFQFQPAVQPPSPPPVLATVLATTVAPQLQHQLRLPRRCRTARAKRITAPASCSQVVLSGGYIAHGIKKRLHHWAKQTSMAPVMDDESASFLLAVLGLIFGVGGIMLICFLGGGVGISFGILGILLGVYLGLWAGLLGEFPNPESKPFRINTLFKLK